MQPGAAPRDGAALSFRGVTKRFGRREVLADLTLDTASGECFGLVGINGAGKTTCIKGLLDFSRIDGGTIEIFGVPHTDTRARAAVGFLPERFVPPYYLRGRDFLAYMSRLQGRRHDDEAAVAMCRRLDLDDGALARPVRDYSKGMAQKLGLAACLLGASDLLVLDEPMSGLDPKARLLVKRLLLERKAGGTALFFSTHMLADVGELCDRLGILHDGRLRFVGTPEECLRAHGCDSLEEAYLRCIS